MPIKHNTHPTNSNITLTWFFNPTDLTEGGTMDGVILQMPNPIDNALTIDMSINGGTAVSQTFPDQSSGNDFFFPFDSFANAGSAAVSGSTICPT